MEDAEVTLAKAGIHEGGSQPRLKRVRGFTCEVCYDDETKETLAVLRRRNEGNFGVEL